jgi:hypothetical protein
MANASTRAVFGVVGVSLRSILKPALLLGASSLAFAAFPSAALAACVGDGTANTCTLVLAGPAANEADIATGTGDGAGGTDTLRFTGGGFLSLDAKTIGTPLGGVIRFANYEEGLVTGNTALTLNGLPTDTIQATFNWTIDAGSSLFVQGGNAIGNTSAVTVNGSFALDNADETIGSLAPARTRRSQALSSAPAGSQRSAAASSF